MRPLCRILTIFAPKGGVGKSTLATNLLVAAKLGEAVLERELLAEKLAALEAGRPSARGRPRR